MLVYGPSEGYGTLGGNLGAASKESMIAYPGSGKLGSSSELGSKRSVAKTDGQKVRKKKAGCCHLSTTGSEVAKTIKYLPMKLQGCTVLIEEGKNKWRVTNALQANTLGLAYRKTKNVDDRLENAAAWGDLITGYKEDEEWLRCETEIKAGKKKRASCCQ